MTINRTGTKRFGNWGERNSLDQKTERSCWRDLADPGIWQMKMMLGLERPFLMGKWIRKGQERIDTDTVDSASDLFLADSRCSQYVYCIAGWLNEWICIQALGKKNHLIQ